MNNDLRLGDFVTKITGSGWVGKVVGFYSTALTPSGVCVESCHHKGSVQIYPAKALAPVDVEQGRFDPLIFEMIREWARQRQLLPGDPEKQFVKLTEEVIELEDAMHAKDDGEIVDALGDCVVVLTVLAAQYGCCLEHCISLAYNEIKDRKGKTVNGIFIKD